MNTYALHFAYNTEKLTVDDIDAERIDSGDTGLLVDMVIDQLEKDGCIGCFIGEDAELEFSEDVYIIGGNHGLKLYHGGNLHYTKL